MLQANMQKEKHHQLTLASFHRQTESLKNWREYFITSIEKTHRTKEKSTLISSNANGNNSNIYTAFMEMNRENYREFRKLHDKIDQGFNHVYAEMNRRFGAVDKEFKDMRAEMNRRFGAVDKEFKNVYAKIDELRDKIDGISRQQNSQFKWMMTVTISILSIMISALGFVAS